MDVYKSIDLFAGIGGIRLGFEKAFGERCFSTVFVSEFDQNACRTYAANFSTPNMACSAGIPMLFDPYIYGDITKIAASDIPPFEHGDFAKVYEEEGEYYFNLNFQIRYR